MGLRVRPELPLLLLITGATAACGAESITISPPQIVGAQTLVVATPHPNGFAYYALRLGGASRVAVPIPEDVTPQAYALAFPESVEALGLSEGPLTLVASGEDGQSLGTPLARLSGQTIDGSFQWDPIDAVPKEMEDLRIPPTVECVRYGAAEVRIDVDGDFEFIQKLNDRFVLVATDSFNPPWLVDAITGDITPVEDELIRYARAATRVDDQVFVGDIFGRVYQGTASSTAGLVRLSRLDWEVDRSVLGMTGGRRSDGTIELFAVGNDLTYQRGEQPARRLAAPRLHAGASAWAGEGLAFVATEDFGTLLRATPTETRDEVVSSDGVFQSMATVPQLGVVGGTVDGEFFLRRNGEDSFRSLSDRYGWWALGAAPTESGFAFVLASGQLGQFRARVGFCDTLGILPFIDRGDLAVMPDSLVVAARPDGLLTTRIVIFPRL